MTGQVQNHKNPVYTIVFLILCGAILLFLLRAPEETTATLPHDDNHERFFPMEKKEAEKYCTECHGDDKMVPFPKNHPPKYRCLFCHKRVRKSPEK